MFWFEQYVPLTKADTSDMFAFRELATGLDYVFRCVPYAFGTNNTFSTRGFSAPVIAATNDDPF